VGDTTRAEDRRLVLLVDHEVESRRHTRHLLELHGMEMVQATNGIAALELIQRLPQSFRLVLTEIDLPGLSGAVVAETLRIFRPDLPTFCMSREALAGRSRGRRCLAKPLQGPDLEAAIRQDGAFADGDGRRGPGDAVIARARARFAVAGDLVEAAMELARATGEEEGS
jgi:CheY-like chemotaxis protein